MSRPSALRAVAVGSPSRRSSRRRSSAPTAGVLVESSVQSCAAVAPSTAPDRRWPRWPRTCSIVPSHARDEFEAAATDAARRMSVIAGDWNARRSRRGPSGRRASTALEQLLEPGVREPPSHGRQSRSSDQQTGAALSGRCSRSASGARPGSRSAVRVDERSSAPCAPFARPGNAAQSVIRLLRQPGESLPDTVVRGAGGTVPRRSLHCPRCTSSPIRVDAGRIVARPESPSHGRLGREAHSRGPTSTRPRRSTRACSLCSHVKRLRPR